MDGSGSFSFAFCATGLAKNDVELFGQRIRAEIELCERGRERKLVALLLG